MRYCRDCGSVVNEDNNFCPSCGAMLHMVPNQNTSTNNTTKSEDGNSFGYNLLSFLIPLAGLILYLVWISDYPIRAKGCGKWALISVIVDVIISILSVIFIIYISFLGGFYFLLF